jgi:hypothetical protein
MYRVQNNRSFSWASCFLCACRMFAEATCARRKRTFTDFVACVRCVFESGRTMHPRAASLFSAKMTISSETHCAVEMRGMLPGQE